jgi:DNA-binding Lrp family transcriptional regulator
MRATLPPDALDATDRLLINRLQEGLPFTRSPFAPIAREVGISETEVVDRIAALRGIGAITRFGPFLDAEAIGGAFCLCAMAVPAERFDAVAASVNALPEVAHNYERQHGLNMWFVLACEKPEGIAQAAARIEAQTGLRVLRFPKLKEFFVGFRVEA